MDIMKDIFCARCQMITPHSGVVDVNGEYLFTCTNVITEATDKDEAVVCDRFIKYPADISKEDFETKLVEHEEQNVGQVSLEEQEKKLLELVGETNPEDIEEKEE